LDLMSRQIVTQHTALLIRDDRQSTRFDSGHGSIPFAPPSSGMLSCFFFSFFWVVLFQAFSISYPFFRRVRELTKALAAKKQGPSFLMPVDVLSVVYLGAGSCRRGSGTMGLCVFGEGFEEFED